MFLLLSFLYRETTRVRTRKSFYCMADFGFSVNGTYDVAFTDFARGRPYCFALLTSEAFRNLAKENLAGQPCRENGTSHSHVIDCNCSSFNVAGTIGLKSVYVPYLSLLNHSDGGLMMTVVEVFRNPNSCLDYRWDGVIIGKAVVLGLMFAIAVFWAVNWFCHFSVQVAVHYFLTTFFVLAFICAGVHTAELLLLDRQDDAHGLTVLHYVTRVLAEVLFYGTILLIAKGWCIVRDSISMREIVQSMCYSILFLFFRLMLDVIQNSVATPILAIFCGLSMALFLRELLTSSKEGTTRIRAHLLAIANQGINPTTTPIFQKHRLYRKFQIFLVGSSILLFAYICASIVVTAGYVTGEIMGDGLVLIVVTCFCGLFRLRGTGRGSYARMADGGDDEPAEILMADLDGFSIDSDRMKGGKVWQEGMELPGQPLIVVASPSGVGTMEAAIAPD